MKFYEIIQHIQHLVDLFETQSLFSKHLEQRCHNKRVPSRCCYKQSLVHSWVMTIIWLLTKVVSDLRSPFMEAAMSLPVWNTNQWSLAVRLNVEQDTRQCQTSFTVLVTICSASLIFIPQTMLILYNTWKSWSIYLHVLILVRNKGNRVETNTVLVVQNTELLTLSEAPRLTIISKRGLAHSCVTVDVDLVEKQQQQKNKFVDMVALKIVKIPNKETLDPICKPTIRWILVFHTYHNIFTQTTFLITLTEPGILSNYWDIYQPCFWPQKWGF